LVGQHAVKLILDSQIPFSSLRIADVECGTGTTSLTFGLLGAPISLIDLNKYILRMAQNIYKFYDYEAELFVANCMDPAADALRGKFDLVISSGLTEHFAGDDRKKCIRYHRLLLNERGFAYIGVPNKLSPFYQWIKAFKKLTGKWNIDIELPYSKQEVEKIAAKVGFKEAYVVGNATL
jgi:SAM-dependent methyltransferase